MLCPSPSKTFWVVKMVSYNLFLINEGLYPNNLFHVDHSHTDINYSMPPIYCLYSNWLVGTSLPGQESTGFITSIIFEIVSNHIFKWALSCPVTMMCFFTYFDMRDNIIIWVGFWKVFFRVCLVNLLEVWYILVMLRLGLIMDVFGPCALTVGSILANWTWW